MTTAEAIKHCEAYLPDTDIKNYVIEKLRTSPKASKWKYVYSFAFHKMVYQCGSCGCEKVLPTPFCSECGADMQYNSIELRLGQSELYADEPEQVEYTAEQCGREK